MRECVLLQSSFCILARTLEGSELNTCVEVIMEGLRVGYQITLKGIARFVLFLLLSCPKVTLNFCLIVLTTALHALYTIHRTTTFALH